MAGKVLDGNLVARIVKDEVANEVRELRARGVVPGLGTILVGDDPSSSKYVAMKHRDCEEVGIVSHHRHLPANSTFESLLEVISSFNENSEIDSILLQLPIPKHLNQLEALLAIDPRKDVDGLHPVNLGKLVMSEEAPLPCTPAGIVRLLAHYEIEVEGRHVVVVGRGLTIGRPLALLLASKRPNCNATVTVCHTGSNDMASVVSQGDIVVAAAGVANLITASMVKVGAVVVGAGTPFVDGKLASDVADDVAEVASAITPRVGGVGPMTRAMLLRNTVSAARLRP
ncbi:MAG: bifunctional methylenetetrahydrofolate dehydrogenase/methenyltetrahydrofolate cyclohydrolase [Actinomycetota bacterium]|nr:bifunctional methylenetetrahydrofolate dehydrogenase/methenyltetrahydrofolate cyclohydrolase [Actinomycetota bacterium]